MRNIIIPASKSLTISNKIPNENINNEFINVGNDGKYYYYSYLFFDISPIPSNIVINSAEIILFKVKDFFNCNTKVFSIYPLSDYFSTFTTYKNHPRINTQFKYDFLPFTNNIYIEVNITDILEAWINNTLINKGIILIGDNNQNCLTTFASALNKDPYLIPFLRVSFQESSIEVIVDYPFKIPYRNINWTCKTKP
ncbi:DNRLRE domain-containing protein [Tepidibacter thalassicus]|uniref:Carbohydrate-binding module family 96 domain-containing protein n=1 Tax=Tepidibacter thalassicus DSM 15285 TaxID=1123350 RepID=A0A1M5PHG2_9FIRM|nr:DNRLRE domain-containing protein [Tepidibacter thalassicus]SHH01180.1 hypothetical protein SAMN02744040_00489 [Tepidibacter thalassicus DSM 15285]